ncbi:MAG: hypothetical protein KDD62_03850 [Bdellovibrionales bacterium]|nr:hypothetical protein [Bdellovibrionales bacterium]
MSDQVAQGDNKSSDSAVQPWSIKTLIPQVSDAELKFSRGYLRCRPEKWFPGFGSQWLTLSHSLGTEFVCSSVKASLKLPEAGELCYGASIAGEMLGISFNQEAYDAIANIVSPGAAEAARDVVVEYVVRRFLGSFALSWSGPELGEVDFHGRVAQETIGALGSVTLALSAGGAMGSLHVLLGPKMVARMDGLWRRQVKSTSSQNTQESMSLDYEIACLPLAADKVDQYLKKGTTLDLQVGITDRIAIRIANQDWLPGKLRLSHGNFTVEILSGPLSTTEVPQGAKRLGVLLGSQLVAADDVRELAQVGAMIDTGIPAGDVVKLNLDDRFVASGVLRTYDGRFVVTVA